MKNCALSLAAFFVLAMACGGAAPDKVVSEFITAWNFGEGSNVVNLMSTEALADMNSTINMLKPAPEEDGNTAVVNITVDGETREISLVHANGNWQIDDGLDFM